MIKIHFGFSRLAIEPAEAGEFEAGLLLDEYSPDFWAESFSLSELR